MPKGKFISYIRVSTVKQGLSGLGLDAQTKAIAEYLNGGDWELIAEFVEIESGKKDSRIQLQEALKHCQMTGATLIIAKLDRLSRDLHFISSIQKAGIDFVACDVPSACKFTIHIFAALAEHERELISQRTKAALKIAKGRGVKLGTNNLTEDGARKGAGRSLAARIKKADLFASQIAPIVQEQIEQGHSLNKVAEYLNKSGILTARGRAGGWTARAVKNLLARLV